MADTGLDDFGDPSYRDGRDVLVAALDGEARLNEIGAVALEAQVLDALRNRLRLTHWRTTHPEVADAPITAPLFVIGLPRTGTTLLSALLAEDPRRRALRRFEAGDPVPPPEAATFATDPRIEATRAASGMLDALNPGFKAIHHEPAEGPTECVTLLAQHFTSLLWETIANVPTYGQWLLAADQRAAYRYHHDALQVLQSRAPGQWSLKSPHHGLALDALLAQYPDARVVVTHRDPVPVIGSLCSLVRSLSGTFSDADHTAYIATHWVAVAEAIVTRTAEARATHPDAAFLDVDYDRLVRAPLAVMQDVAAFTDTELTPDVAARLRAYLAANGQGKFGPHTYDLTEFGLHPDEIRARFPTEPAPA
ncbi:MAG: sulfotransferase family protein [Actinomycetota bacterium]